MFEAVEEKKEESTSRLWIGVAVVAALVAGGIWFYTTSSRTAEAPVPAAASKAAAAKAAADPVHDLKVQRATMDKDRMGTTAVWLITIENRSTTYTYSDIKYETTYIGAGEKALLINQGTIAASIDPGEQNKSELRDALYPAGTLGYRFRITGATAASH